MLYLTDHPEDPVERQARMALIAERRSGSSRPPRPPRGRRRQAPEPQNGFDL
jgi:hypothetical protein